MMKCGHISLKAMFITYLGSVVLLSGCATTSNMALSPDVSIPNILSTNSLVLVVIETSREGSADWVPIVGTIVRGRESEGEGGGSVGVPLNVVSCNDNITMHLISLSLPKENYLIRRLNGGGMICGQVTSGSFLSPPGRNIGHFTFNMDLNVTPVLGKIVYAGRIKAYVRSRKSDSESRAASSMFPLLDQVLTQFYLSTYEITIEDRFDEDIAAFRSKFPALKEQDILKSIAVKKTTSAALEKK